MAASSAAAAKITSLVDWALSHGALLHPNVEVYHDPSTGFSFRVRPTATAPLLGSDSVSGSDAAPIVRLPTSLSLSYLNAVSDENPGVPLSKTILSSSSARPAAAAAAALASAPPPIPPTLLLPPHVLGRLFLIKEYLAGESSFWAPYIRALPQPDDPASWLLPPFWDPDDVELLDGTNLEVGLARVRADLAAEIAAIRAVLARRRRRSQDEEEEEEEEEEDSSNKSLRSHFCPNLYHWAYAIFSSRSFRPSLALSDEQCRLDGALSAADDFSVLLPLFDLGNHEMTAPVRWKRCSSSESPSPSPSSLSDGPRSRQDYCEFHVGKAYQPGEQVFNNYGLKTNAELLLGYGFMVPPTEALHNDYIHVRKRASAAAVANSSSSNSNSNSADGSAPPPPTGTSVSDEYLISARPVQDPSSVLARARLLVPFSAVAGVADTTTTTTTTTTYTTYTTTCPVNTTAAMHIAPAFEHVQPEMVWDIFTSLATSPETRRQLMPVSSAADDHDHENNKAAANTDDDDDDDDAHRKALFLAGKVDGECLAYFAQTAAVIQHKVLQELERLDETDVQVDDDDDDNALTTCQRLALDYRRYCRVVLETTLETMNTDQTLAAAAAGDESS